MQWRYDNRCNYEPAPIYLLFFNLTDVIIYYVLCTITLCELICLDSASYPRNPAAHSFLGECVSVGWEWGEGADTRVT